MKYRFFLVVFLFSFSLYAQNDSYYSAINPNNSTFVNDLKGRIRAPYTKISYDNFDETNVANYASYEIGGGMRAVRCVYSWYEFSYIPPFGWGVMSREHTFCHSWMPTYPSESGNEYSDQHHLFPTQQNNANGVRNNHPLGVVTTISSSFGDFKYGKNSSGVSVGEPRNQHKGDAARALLYMCVRYDDINGNTWNFNWLNGTKLPSLSEGIQDLNVLLQWHRQDPPDKWEVERNNYIESIQQNRNPFIDHPEYVDYINFNDLTKLSPVYSTEPSNHVTGLSASVTDNSITLNWTGATGSVLPSGYLIQVYNMNSYYIPIDGYSLAENTSLDSFKVKYVTHQTGANSYTFTGLTTGKTYYFAIYPYNGDGISRNYFTTGNIPKISASAGTALLATEPTNQPTGLNASNISSSTINLNWTDAAAGTQAPSGYLILANNNNSFSNPVDGFTYTNDANLSDGSALVNVSTGVQQYAFSSLSPSTTYYFRIYSYNGTGNSRNYKTDNIPSLTQVTTNPTIIPLIISEYVEGSSNNKAIELYNASTSTINLADYVLFQFNNGASRTSGTRYALTFSSTILNPGAAYVIVNTSASSTLLAKANLITSSSVLSFNGDDALAVYKAADVSGTTINSSAVEVDIFGEIGVDPGTSWSSGGVSTVDKTLRRKSTVYSPVTSNPSGFNPSIEYEQYSLDTYDGLGTHVFGGSITSSQEIPARTYTNLILNGSGVSVTLSGNVIINGTLSLTDGNLFIGSNDLILGSGTTISGTPSATNMIVADGTGQVIKYVSGTGAFTFPVGDNTGSAEYSPVTLNFTSGSFGAGAYVGLNLKNEVHPQNVGSPLRVNRYWTVTQSGISGFNCNAEFNILESDVVGSPQSSLYCWKWNGASWTQGNSISGNILSFNNLNSFSDFTGSGVDQPLPVNLASFSSIVNINSVKVNWVTSQEINNSGFYLERINNEELAINNWKSVGFINGQGTKSTPTSYSFEDRNMQTGRYSYRLKQVDYNGNFEYFMLENEVEIMAPKKFNMSQNYPNPFNPETKISYDIPSNTLVKLVIYDVMGRELKTLVKEIQKPGVYEVKWNASGFASGVYFARIEAGSFTKSIKLLLMK